MLCNPFGVTDFIVYATQGALVYVSNGEVDEVLIYNGANGSFLQKFLTPGLGGLDDPKGLLFDRDGSLLVVNNGDHSVRRFGASSQAAFTVSLSAPDAMPVTLDYSTTNGTAVAGSDFVAVSGMLTFAPGETTRTLLVRTLDDTVVEPTETFSVNLSNPVGATIADGQGVATIFDIATKFYVVNDATVNQTYEYASGGVLVESYNLGTGNTAPRGAASNAAGTTVWVVDANKKVYVYNPSGGLVGSWTAGSLQSNAQVEGVATNGTDVWLVDNKTDKVFKYTGAASRLSGSQNAASSFSLNSGNRNPKDIVTDGVSLWVVNDSTTDKVFKYTLAGTLVGSWTISTSGAGSPTGITIDPTNVSDIWIVDAFADKVFQYTAAASRSSGSQSAATSFALAAGNTNPPRHRRSADTTSGRCDARASGPRVPRDRIDARGGGGLLLEHRTQPTGPTPSGVARRQLPRVTRRSGSVARDDEGSQTQPAMTEFSTVPYRVVHGRSVVVREYTRWPVRTAHAAPAGATVNSQGCKPLDTES